MRRASRLFPTLLCAAALGATPLSAQVDPGLLRGLSARNIAFRTASQRLGGSPRHGT